MRLENLEAPERKDVLKIKKKQRIRVCEKPAGANFKDLSEAKTGTIYQCK